MLQAANTEVEQLNRLDAFDTYTYLILGATSMIACILMIISHLLVAKLRKSPGDLVIMIAFAEFCLSLHWFMSAVRTKFITSDYEDDSFFCQANSVIAVTSATLEITYNLSFVAHVWFSVKNSIRSGYMPKKTYHVVCWSIMLCQFLYSQKKMYQRNPYGTCSIYPSDTDILIGSSIIFFSLILAIYVYSFTKSNLPTTGQDAMKVRSEFFNFYRGYIKTMISMWIIIFASFICQYTSRKDQNSYWFTLGRIGNTAKVVMPLILIFVRTDDPKLQKELTKWWREKILNQKIKANSEGDYERTTLDNIDANFGSIAGEVAEIELIGDSGDSESEFFLGMLPIKIKESITRSFLASVSLHYNAVLQTHRERITELGPHSSQELSRFEIKASVLSEKFKTDCSFTDSELTIYGGHIFSKIVDTHPTELDFSSSLNLFLNHAQIQKAGESGGGASGEMFMFSHDKKLIIKTITNEEYSVFVKILFEYGQHFSKHKQSLIGKIFGLFDFKFSEGLPSLKIILMENLFTMPSDAILRKYDMKGSKHDRQVLQNYDETTAETKVSKILKDLDFTKIDKHIETIKTRQNGKSDSFNANLGHNDNEDNIRLEFIARVAADVEFFRKHKIIDYSLIVAVVDLKLMPAEAVETHHQLQAGHTLLSADSRYLYQLGIIDYFQLFTFKKMSERWLKRIRHCDCDLQTSSQPPNRYSVRFLQFVQQIIV
jgi:1-phosphatidylinositol-4-phosphate 5-kinase